MNFMLLVPLASKPAVEIWFETSAAGISRSASETQYSGRKTTLMPSADRGIAVDRAGQIVDELDDELGQLIGRRRFAREEEGAGRHLQVRVRAQPIVQTR